MVTAVLFAMYPNNEALLAAPVRVTSGEEAQGVTAPYETAVGGDGWTPLMIVETFMTELVDVSGFEATTWELPSTDIDRVSAHVRQLIVEP
jgi:hypothetical protein